LITIRTLTGSLIRDIIPELANLRITVFRDFPYLYDGSLEYEERYLGRYTISEQCIVVIVKDDDRIVGASTGMPLADEANEITSPIRLAGHNVDDWYYFAESVLLPEYRGRRLGYHFFDERERHAIDFGYKMACFCSVVRESDHPRRPESYKRLDNFWNKRGFTRSPDLQTNMMWKEHDEPAESPKLMEYWIKSL